MVSIIAGAENDDFEACDNIFQTGHLMSLTLVKLNFNNKKSKMLLNRIRKNKPLENGE